VGQTCNQCGGTIRCDGSCFPPLPPRFGSPCTVCIPVACFPGTIGCDGTCVPTGADNPPGSGGIGGGLGGIGGGLGGAGGGIVGR
jgi:hypothetical protein